MEIKILCIEYLLWRILTTKSMFDVVNMLNKITAKCVPINNCELLNTQACSFDMFWNKGCTQSLVVSCIYWVVPLISNRASGYSEVILLDIKEQTYYQTLIQSIKINNAYNTAIAEVKHRSRFIINTQYLTLPSKLYDFDSWGFQKKLTLFYHVLKGLHCTCTYSQTSS